MTVSYTVESIRDGKPLSLGNTRTSAGAQIYMRDYIAKNPATAYQVVEEPSRCIVASYEPAENDAHGRRGTNGR